MITNEPLQECPAHEQHSGKSSTRRGEHALYERKHKTIKGLLRTSFSSVSIYDFQRQEVVYSQWKLLHKLGYTPEEYRMVSAHFFKAIRHPQDERVIGQLIEKIQKARHRQIVKGIFRIKDKEGIYHTIVLRCSVLRHEKNGAVKELIGSTIDVSGYRSIKRKLTDNMQLIRELSYRNSHELRAPVATALGLLSLIKTEMNANNQDREMVDILEETILRMDNVIRDFGHTLEDAKHAG